MEVVSIFYGAFLMSIVFLVSSYLANKYKKTKRYNDNNELIYQINKIFFDNDLSLNDKMYEADKLSRNTKGDMAYGCYIVLELWSKYELKNKKDAIG